MAKQQDPRWQLDLRPVAPGRGAAGMDHANTHGAADAQQQGVDDIVRLLVTLQESVDGVREAVEKIGKRVAAVERAIRERDSEVGEVAVRPLREAKRVRPIPPLRLESRARASRPRAVNEGDSPGR